MEYCVIKHEERDGVYRYTQRRLWPFHKGGGDICHGEQWPKPSVKGTVIEFFKTSHSAESADT